MNYQCYLSLKNLSSLEDEGPRAMNFSYKKKKKRKKKKNKYIYIYMYICIYDGDRTRREPNGGGPPSILFIY
jgi:hypothetical protein